MKNNLNQLSEALTDVERLIIIMYTLWGGR